MEVHALVDTNVGQFLQAYDVNAETLTLGLYYLALTKQ